MSYSTQKVWKQLNIHVSNETKNNISSFVSTNHISLKSFIMTALEKEGVKIAEIDKYIYRKDIK